MVAAKQPIYRRCCGDNSATGDQMTQNEKPMKSPRPVMTSESWGVRFDGAWRNTPFEALDICKLTGPSDHLSPQCSVDH
jgi:hypothetical protein